MANLSEDIVWEDGIYRIEETDVVLGGEDGTSNKQIKQLANRTSWLKQELGKFEDILPISSNMSILAGQLRMLLLGTDKAIATLPDTVNVLDGTRIFVAAVMSANYKYLALQPNSGNFNIGRKLFGRIYLYDGEFAEIVLNNGIWTILRHEGSNKVGEEIYGRAMFKNCLALDGSLVNRSDYPRLTEWVLANLSSGGLVSDAQWLSDPVRYRGMFSNGDGSTTLRLPDERGLFVRGLDLGRGLDLYRMDNVPGGYEISDNEKHQHGYRDGYYVENGSISQMKNAPNRELLPPNYNNKTGSGGTDTDDDTVLYLDRKSDFSGTESRPKNIGKIPQIRF